MVRSSSTEAIAAGTIGESQTLISLLGSANYSGCESEQLRCHVNLIALGTNGGNAPFTVALLRLEPEGPSAVRSVVVDRSRACAPRLLVHYLPTELTAYLELS